MTHRHGQTVETGPAEITVRTGKPEDLDAVMRLYRDLDMRDDARKAYKRLVKTLNDHLHVAPSPQVQQLADQIGS